MNTRTRRLVTAAIKASFVLSLALSAAAPPPAFAHKQAESTIVACATAAPVMDSARPRFKTPDSGTLAVIGPDGQVKARCPLKHTTVKTSISGYVARVTVKQVFANPLKEKIEAVYTFPLSETGAVDDMTMKVGARVIKGTIKRKEEARKIYETARDRGQVASLLDQERPNIFTQSVANIKPGEKVEITLQYVDLLPYEDGSFTFAFPTVVGPRFNPGMPAGRSGTGWSPDTTGVPDASRITPPVTPEGTRAGHDIDIEVSVDAGLPIENITAPLHDVNVSRQGQSRALVSLKDKATIPNRDFVLRWQVAGDKLRSGYLTHRDSKGGYFTLMLVPPKRVTVDKIAPREMIFLIDCSGSQSGRPLDKAKETLLYIVDRMNPQDTFQIIAFNNNVTELFERPRAASEDMRRQARAFINNLSANGGTWMAPAVETACATPADGHRLRIVTFMTDGYVGNDMEIIGMVKKLRGKSRWFPFGTGNSVNRFLIDEMAKQGGGEADYVLLNSSGSEVARKFYEKISSPVLTDVKVEFEGVETKEVFPHELSDVWAQRPLYIKGRYTKAGKGTAVLSGYSAGKPYTQRLDVVFPETQPDNAVIASLWARAKVDRLMAEDWIGAQRGTINKELKEEVIDVALSHHILTQFTSFVAVEETVVSEGGKPRTVVVPVEMPDGVSYEGVFGREDKRMRVAARHHAPAAPAPLQAYSLSQQSAIYGAPNAGVSMGGSGGGGGYAGGYGGGYGGGYVTGYGGSTARPTAVRGMLNKQSTRYGNEPAAERKAKSEDEIDAMTVRQPAAKDEAVKLDIRLRQLAVGKKSDNQIAVVDGKVTVKIWLNSASDAALKKLKDAGVEIVSHSRAKLTVIARIDVAKLKTIAGMDIVRLIEPAKNWAS